MPTGRKSRAITRDGSLALPTELSADERAWLEGPRPPLARAVEPFSGNLRSGKNTTSYRAHSYHTKVPPGAIRPLVEHYTSPGALVVDPFCGSGMTGVAALQSGRHAIISDLAPAAVHIARNYTTPCDVEQFDSAFAAVEDMVAEKIASLYQVPGTKNTVEYTVWSDLFECPRCRASLLYWEAARNEVSGEVTEVRCSKCRSVHSKRDLRWTGERPVQTNVSSTGGGPRGVHAPTKPELSLIERAESGRIRRWVPAVPFGSDREMWRASHAAMGVNSVADFYSKRNLAALAEIRHAIMAVEDVRSRDALMFTFTAVANRASKRYQWNAKRPTNVMGGTLYISSLRYEWNVWSLFRRKFAAVRKHFAEFQTPATRCTTVLKSADSLDHLPDGSVDLVFLDPPFGSNIFYADSSLLWEAWLGNLTAQEKEIVVNKKRTPEVGGKTLEGYAGLMAAALAEVRRVLRRGSYAVLAFNNTDDSVWCALQDAIGEAGLEVAATSQLDKVHPSIKGVKGLQGHEQIASLDALLSLRPARRRTRRRSSLDEGALRARVGTVLTKHVRGADGEEPAPRIDELHSIVVRDLLETGTPVSGVTFDLVRQVYEETT